MRLLLTVLLSMCTTLFAFAEEGEISDSLKEQRRLFPQEKVYVMTDRELYSTGDTIWFRGWIVDGETMKEKQVSRYLYVELRDPACSLIKRVRIMVNDDGIYEGYLPLEISLPSNQYTLAAYTYYMLGTNDAFFFKKPIDVLKPEDILAGITTDALKNRVYPENIAENKQTFTFDVPANGRYAVSVTNLTNNPSNGYAINTCLPKQPNLFDEEDVRNKSTYLVPTFPYEQGTVVSGTVYGNFSTWRKQKNVPVTAVAFCDSVRITEVITDEQGHFELPLPECPDSTVFMIQAYKNNNAQYNIELDKSILPETVKALRVSQKHFVKNELRNADDDNTQKWALAVKNGQSVMLDEIVVKEKHTNALYNFQEQTTKTKILTEEESLRFNSYTQLLLTVGVHKGMYHSHKVKYYFDRVQVNPRSGFDLNVINSEDDQSTPLSSMNELSEEDMLSTFYPIHMIKAVEILNTNEAQTFPGRAYEWETYVVNFITKKGADANIAADFKSNYKPYMPLGAQTPTKFTFPTRGTGYSAPVIYWNPNEKSDSEGKLQVTIPTLSQTTGTYRIIVEGVGENGELVHREECVRMKGEE